MANLKEIRTRISSTESTKQITSAMKLVAASKLRKAQDSIEKMRPYSQKLNEIMGDISSGETLNDVDNGLLKNHENADKTLIVTIAANKGLCGAFNANVIKKTTQLAQENLDNKVDIITIGKKATEVLSKNSQLNHIDKYDDLLDDINWEDASDIASKFIDKYKSGEYKKIVLVYNKFKNAATQIVQDENYLPIEKLSSESAEKQDETEYILEPSKEIILDQIIPKTLKIQFYKAILDSNAAEQGARMTAMHQATDNATEIIKELKLSYNKARQAAITNEIIEIVSGANAL